MPSWLRRLLETAPATNVRNIIRRDGTLEKVESLAANEVNGTIPVLAQLCERDISVERAYLCHPCVRHVFRITREGGFCGYRNIQMMISYIRGTRTQGWQRFQDGCPSVLRLQDMIEDAWDLGFNSLGRVETGGVRGTRKYIGTPEVS